MGVMLDTDALEARVTRPVPGSPAADAGLRPGDVILAIDETPVGSAAAVVDLVARNPVGATVQLRVRRDDVVLTLPLTLGARPDTDRMAGLLVGAPFPFHPVTALDGTTVTPTATTPVTIVEFWATWCGPCHAAAPTMAAIRDRHADDVLTVYAISSEATEHVADYVGRSSVMNWAVYTDESGVAEGEAFVTSLPTWFVLDADGTVVEVHTSAGGIHGVGDAVDRLAAQAAALDSTTAEPE